MNVSFEICILDEKLIPLAESKKYQHILNEYGEEFARQFVLEYEVKLREETEVV